MTLKKREDIGILKRKHKITLSGKLASKEAFACRN
jgi:hypothetical protein